MRISLQRSRRNGSILAVTLVSACLLGLGLASYLTLVMAQHRAVARSLAWNSAMPVAESGLEEGLTQIYHHGTNTPADNWTLVSGTLYHKVRTVGSDGSYYDVGIQLTNPPTITSIGYSSLPSGGGFISRTVQIRTQKGTSTAGGLTARGKITFSGGAFLDSFDSSDPNYSTNGLYISTRRKDNGSAVSNSSASGAISLSGGGVYGAVGTGPGGTITWSGSAKVGDLGWWNAGSTGIQTGHSANNANVDFPAVDVPFTGGGYTPTTGTYNGTNYTYLLTGGNYFTSSKLTIPGGGAMAITGNVVLYVDNDFVTSGSGFVYMYPGATLKLYVSGAFTVSGGGIVNSTLTASSLSVLGLNTTTESWTYSGSAAFIGTVYAPNSNFTFSGGAGASGAFTANTVTISGSAGVHYDENLLGARRGYVVSQWNEL
jgi:hypothetical protein